MKTCARTKPARLGVTLLLAALIGALSSACATVRPEQRSILADPLMQFESESPDQKQRQHVLENREGSMGGGSVEGGGCGCN